MLNSMQEARLHACFISLLSMFVLLLCSSSMMNAWLENERNSMRFLNHLLCRPLRDLWTEDPPEMRARAGAARWRPVIRLHLPITYYGLCPALYKAL